MRRMTGRSDRTACATLAMTLTALMLGTSTTGFASAAPAVTPKAALEHDVAISKAASARFMTVTKTGIDSGKASLLQVDQFSMRAHVYVARNTATGPAFAIDTATRYYFETSRRPHSTQMCWTYGIVAGMFHDDAKVRFAPFGRMTPKMRVTEVAVDFRDGARSKFTVSVPDAEVNSGGRTVHTVLVGARGRLLSDEFDDPGDDDPYTTLLNLFSYPNSEPHVTLPTGKRLCPAKPHS
jgi:hypothetical protein